MLDSTEQARVPRRTFAHRLAASLAWRGIHLVRIFLRTLGAPIPFEAPEGVEVRRLDEPEALGLATDAELDLSPAWIREAFRRPGGCVAAYVDGELAGYIWYAYEQAPDSDGVWLAVPPGATYRYKAYVRPRFRGRRITPILSRRVDDIAVEEGRRFTLAFIAVHNEPSLNAARAIGSRPVGYALYGRIGGRFFAFRSRRVRQLGLRFHEPGKGPLPPA